MSKLDFSRRTTLAGIGAGAALLGTGMGAGVTVAAPRKAAPLLSLENVALAWPMYQRLESFDVPPAIGDSVMLERGGKPFDTDAVIVRDMMGARLGTVARKDAPEIAHAMDRGGRVKAHISAIEHPMVKAARLPGWGHLLIAVEVEKRDGAIA